MIRYICGRRINIYYQIQTMPTFQLAVYNSISGLQLNQRSTIQSAVVYMQREGVHFDGSFLSPSLLELSSSLHELLSELEETL